MPPRQGSVLYIVGLAAVILLPGVAAIAQAPPPVEVTPVVKRAVNSAYRAVGTVRPERTSTIGAASAGRVERFSAIAGTAVKAGQELAHLRTGTLEIELRAAEAELDLFQQQLAEIENGSLPEEIAEALARARGAMAAMNNANNQLQRTRGLVAASAATQADLDDATERAEFTKYAHEATQALLQRVKDGPRNEQVAQAKARVDLQSEQVNLIRDRILKHTIIAPFDGYISAEFTEVGAWINGGDAVASVIELSAVEIETPATTDVATRLRPGDSVRVEFPEMPNKLLVGKVDRIVPIADARSRTFPVLVKLDNEIVNGLPVLLAGMLARVHLPSGDGQVQPLVPKDALVLNGDDRSIFIIEPDANGETGTARKVTVSLGVASDSLIQVAGNVKAGQLVVVEGNERLQPGAKVTIIRSPTGEIATGE